MTNLNPGITGAKRQSWERYNPRDVLRDAIRSRPKASEAEIKEAVWETVRNEREYLPIIFDYWFTNNYRQFFVEEVAEHSVAIRERLTKHRSNQPKREEIEAAKAELRPVLMEHVLSNGKLLRDATFGECAAESGWLREVAKQGRPTAVVGKKLTERDLLALRVRCFSK